jgi:hypothetical protein
MMRCAESKMIGGVSEVTLLTPIKPGLVTGERQTYEQRLSAELESLQERIDQRIPTPIGVMPTIHFARWIILRPRQYLQLSGLAAPGRSEAVPGGCRSWLLFTSNFDGDMKAYLRDFSVFLADDVDRIWSNCEGYPVKGCRDFEQFWSYSKRYQIPTNAFYPAYPDLTVPRIRQLERFKQKFDEFVAGTRLPDGRSVPDMAGAFDHFLAENAQYPTDFPAAGGLFA